MNTLAIFGTQFVLSLVVVTLVAKWFVTPWLAGKPLHFALLVLTLPHAFRHLGLVFLVPGLVGDGIPRTFALAAAYGDFATGLLAILALVALRRHWISAVPLVWLISIVGTADLMNALRQAEAVPHLLTTWYISTFVVPILLVTHGMTFARLIRHARQPSAEPIESLAAC